MDVIYLLVAVGLWVALAALVLACMDADDRQVAATGRPPAAGSATANPSQVRP